MSRGKNMKTMDNQAPQTPPSMEKQRSPIEDILRRQAEARTETKFAQLLGELKAISLSVGNLAGQLGDVKSDIAAVKADVGGVRDATASVKWNILATGIAAGALILGLFAYGAQMIDLATALVGVNK